MRSASDTHASHWKSDFLYWPVSNPELSPALGGSPQKSRRLYPDIHEWTLVSRSEQLRSNAKEGTFATYWSYVGSPNREDNLQIPCVLVIHQETC
jgi:hypothetical protein